MIMDDHLVTKSDFADRAGLCLLKTAHTLFGALLLRRRFLYSHSRLQLLD